MPSPLAFLLTWTTHGAWLHGDNRGSVDRGHETGFGRPAVSPNRGLVRFEQAQSGSAPVVLAEPQREVIEATIRDHLRRRGWGLHALSVRTKHIHLVASGDVAPERIMDQCKAWCTRRLREARLADPDAKLWTRHGSTKYLFTEESLHRAMRYVLDSQGDDLTQRPGPP